MFGTYQRLGVHVADSNLEVIRRVSRKFKPEMRFSRQQKEARKGVYRRMLEYHTKARDLYLYVRTGG